LTLAATAAFVLSARALGAAPIVVNSAGDAADLIVTDGVCDTSSDVGNQCTLRAAIQTANSNPGQDLITFSFEGTAPVTISIASPLPPITDPLVIDGYSVAGAAVNTSTIGTNAQLRIVLAGPRSGWTNGLEVSSPSDISGLDVSGFRTGIRIDGQGRGSHVWGNFIGTDITGTIASPNLRDGIHVDPVGAVKIGGTSLAERNIISGNRKTGILVDTSGAQIVNNLIGIGRLPKYRVGNGGPGIHLWGARSSSIGGVGAAGRNVIANNWVGIAVETGGGIVPTGDRILANSIFSNQGNGIDLKWDGITKNDGPGDPDSGPNGLQNYPTIKSAVTGVAGTVVTGVLVSRANTAYAIRFYSNEPNGREGATFLVTKIVATNSSGRARFAFSMPKRIKSGRTITATAMDRSTGDTSEFSFPNTVD
jgi:titin